MTKKVVNLNIKCLKCELIPCVDFYREKSSLVGGELFLLRQLTQKEKFLPCIPGGLIYAICKCWSALSKKYFYNPVAVVLPQVITDLKCSVFLALCGHQRNAIQVLRPPFENFLIGVVFEDYFRRTQSTQEFNQWTNGKLEEIPNEIRRVVYPKGNVRKKLDYVFALDYMEKFGLLEPKIRQKVNKEIIHPLNQYLHPYFKKFDKSRCKKRCFSDATFNRIQFNEWLNLYQHISTFILVSTINLFDFRYLERNKEFRESLIEIADPSIQQLIKDFVISSEFKRFLSVLQEKYFKECKKR
jgi:hypothetical protein